MGIMADSLKYRYMIMWNENVPAGEYQSVLMEIRKQELEPDSHEQEAGTDNWGYEHIDFCYELIDQVGNVYYIKERYKEKNRRWSELISLLTTYGFDQKTKDDELIGLKEWVDVEYWKSWGRLGNRWPIGMVDITADGYEISFDSVEAEQEEENEKDDEH